MVRICWEFYFTDIVIFIIDYKVIIIVSLFGRSLYSVIVILMGFMIN